MKTFTFYYCSTCHVLAGGLLPKNLAFTGQNSWHIMRKGGDAIPGVKSIHPVDN